MRQLIVTEQPEFWQELEANATVVSPSAYMKQDEYKTSHRLKVINLCKSYQYQSEGYYISLLAEARGHKSLPDVATIRDIKLHDLARQDAEDFDQLIQEALLHRSGNIDFNIYFGMTSDAGLTCFKCQSCMQGS